MTANEWLEFIRKDYKEIEREYLRLEPQKSIDSKRHLAISDTLYIKWGG
ncbi:MAG: hypothetical protein LBH33_04915 [Endomicrobium sp.]|nr:hypothetical protein [Endomicrobium sp.]